MRASICRSEGKQTSKNYNGLTEYNSQNYNFVVEHCKQLKACEEKELLPEPKVILEKISLV